LQKPSSPAALPCKQECRPCPSLARERRQNVERPPSRATTASCRLPRVTLAPQWTRRPSRS
ncbi:hypothetical protein LX36DRAFT_754549, partial [Colletotrichum falcatum]